jgi:hypothetical protein
MNSIPFNEEMTVILNPNVFYSGDSTCSGYSSIQQIGIKIQMSGYHTSGQDICIILYGNIYNWRSFSLETLDTPEDVIRKLYITYGIEYTLQILDGVFSIILLDQRSDLEQSKLYITRDPIGLIPIYFMQHFSMYIISNKYKNENNGTKIGNIQEPEPGTFSTFTKSKKVISKWEHIQNTTYSVLGKSGNCPLDIPIPIDSNKEILRNIILKYVDFAKHIICILEPNNAESYFIADVIDSYFSKSNEIHTPSIETYSIVSDNNEVNSNNVYIHHTNVYINGNVSEQTKMEYLASSIRENNENEDIIVFMGIGINFLKQNSDFDIREKVKNIHKSLGNVIKPFHTENLNVVFPLLDKSWVDFYLSIPPKHR